MSSLPPTPSPSRPPSRGRRSAAAGTILAAVVVIAGLVAVATATSAAGPAQREVVVFDDALGDGFASWSWNASVDPSSLAPVAAGTAAIRADLGPWGGLSLGRYPSVEAPPDATVDFAVHPGTNPGIELQVVVMDTTYRPAGPGRLVRVPAGGWTGFSLPLDELGAPSTIGGIWWQAVGGSNPAPIHVDEVRIVGGGDVPDPDPEPDPDPQPDPDPDPQPDPEPDPDPQPDPDPEPDPDPQPDGGWALEETFDGDPASPSQDLLPDDFDYVATHRSHPGHHFSKTYTPFLVDHAENCAGPNPEVSPLPQRYVETRQDTNGSNPDETFFICKNHMMSSMGDVEGYSVSAFWPRQEFDFADGGVLEFEVNINDAHAVRSWWEVMIVPRDQLKVGSGPIDSPIDETYPDDRIVLDFRRNVRTIKVGTGALAPDGWLAKETQRGQWDWAWWRDLHPDDPAIDDRRIRRTMRIELEDERITWHIETADGGFDSWSVDVPGGLPFDRGLVLFKTHAYNPTKDGNLDTYTFHWDNLRFDGPVVGRYDVHEADDVVYLQRNGDRQIGEQQMVTIDLPSDLGPDPVLFGQLHQPKTGQVLLSVNGGPNRVVHPYQYDRNGNCHSVNWKSFRLPLDPADLRAGENTLTWTIGPRPSCVGGDYVWDGFSAKFLQIQTG
ncbi:MAG: hypothetical protein AAGA93_28160 [Actinomycetota bacterium]